jgi:hypothetical protein
MNRTDPAMETARRVLAGALFEEGAFVSNVRPWWSTLHLVLSGQSLTPPSLLNLMVWKMFREKLTRRLPAVDARLVHIWYLPIQVSPVLAPIQNYPTNLLHPMHSPTEPLSTYNLTYEPIVLVFSLHINSDLLELYGFWTY